MSLKYRLSIIAALVLISIWSLFPRTVVQRHLDREKGMVDDTIRRVPLKYGLDLRGGMHLSLEIDTIASRNVGNVSDALDRALKIIRNRVDQFGVAETVVQKSGNDRITVEIPGIDDPKRAARIVEQAAFLEFKITDKTNALDKIAPRIDQIIKEKNIAVAPDSGKPATTSPGLESLFSKDTTKKDEAKKDTVNVKDDSAKADSTVAGAPGAFRKLVGAGRVPGQFLVRQADYATVKRYLDLPDVKAIMPPGKEIQWQSDTVLLGDGRSYRAFYVLDSRPLITGQDLEDAQPQSNPSEGTLVIFELSNEGGRRFRVETSKHIQDHMAIILDGMVMGEPPVIQSAIGRRGQITMGGRELQAAQDLALVLRAGALPIKLKVAEHRTIGPSLGEDAVRQGLYSGVLGLALVILIMVGYYRFSGFISILGLLFYALTTLAILAFFDAVLTLPGLAGFVLSIGMAVDANVLIFERIREEIVAGKTIRRSIDDGFDHAWTAIIDTHVTTALTAAILYQFGTGPVKGFAVTLLAGLAASLVSAIFVARTFFLAWLNKSEHVETLSI
jgi:preprotein translocase subunit SecD